MWLNWRNQFKNVLSISGESFPNTSRLATAGWDALHCHPVSMATGRHGNWGGRDFVASEVGGGEDGKGTGTIHPRLIRAVWDRVQPQVWFFFLNLSIYSFIAAGDWRIYSCEYYHNRSASLVNIHLTLLLAAHHKYYISALMANVWHYFQ